MKSTASRLILSGEDPKKVANLSAAVSLSADCVLLWRSEHSRGVQYICVVS